MSFWFEVHPLPYFPKGLPLSGSPTTCGDSLVNVITVQFSLGELEQSTPPLVLLLLCFVKTTQALRGEWMPCGHAGWEINTGKQSMPWAWISGWLVSSALPRLNGLPEPQPLSQKHSRQCQFTLIKTNKSMLECLPDVCSEICISAGFKNREKKTRRAHFKIINISKHFNNSTTCPGLPVTHTIHLKTTNQSVSSPGDNHQIEHSILPPPSPQNHQR